MDEAIGVNAKFRDPFRSRSRCQWPRGTLLISSVCRWQLDRPRGFQLQREEAPSPVRTAPARLLSAARSAASLRVDGWLARDNHSLSPPTSKQPTLGPAGEPGVSAALLQGWLRPRLATRGLPGRLWRSRASGLQVLFCAAAPGKSWCLSRSGSCTTD